MHCCLLLICLLLIRFTPCLGIVVFLLPLFFCPQGPLLFVVFQQILKYTVLPLLSSIYFFRCILFRCRRCAIFLLSLFSILRNLYHSSFLPQNPICTILPFLLLRTSLTQTRIHRVLLNPMFFSFAYHLFRSRYSKCHTPTFACLLNYILFCQSSPWHVDIYSDCFGLSLNGPIHWLHVKNRALNTQRRTRKRIHRCFFFLSIF